MSKVICEICGTSYPVANTQCPVCGCVKPIDSGTVTSKDTGASGNYTYVKGGRFSNKNVKKRFGETPKESSQSIQKNTDNNKSKTTRIIIICTVIIVLIAIAIGGYIFLSKFGNALLPGFDFFGSWSDQSGSDPGQTNIPCESIQIAQEDILLEYAEQEVRITVALAPVDTTDVISYISMDPSVATIDDTGKITAVSEGETTVVVTCGSITAECKVVCVFPEDPIEIPVTKFKLNRTDFSLFYAGDSWRLYSGEIPATEVTWSSDNENVAVVELGKVVAVGEGETRIRAVYDGKEYTCIVRVKFKESDSEPNEDIR